jgi:hypothetical protein
MSMGDYVLLLYHLVDAFMSASSVSLITTPLRTFDLPCSIGRAGENGLALALLFCNCLHRANTLDFLLDSLTS